ncbi:MAG TPA: hypothetical protein VFF72_08275 [Caldimonas sp.]|nr:hypothetical protein [Caldimonas sp.]
MHAQPLSIDVSTPIFRSVSQYTLGLAIAAALVVATAELIVLQDHPEAAAPPDAVALAAFGDAVFGPMRAKGTVVVSLPFGLRPIGAREHVDR